MLAVYSLCGTRILERQYSSGHGRGGSPSRPLALVWSDGVPCYKGKVVISHASD